MPDQPAGVRHVDIGEFRRVGYLQELNRQFLHPLGLALEIAVDLDGTERLGGVWDYRDDGEGIRYAPGVLDPAKAERIAQAQCRMAESRMAALGYVMQPVDGADTPETPAPPAEPVQEPPADPGPHPEVQRLEDELDGLNALATRLAAAVEFVAGLDRPLTADGGTNERAALRTLAADAHRAGLLPATGACDCDSYEPCYGACCGLGACSCSINADSGAGPDTPEAHSGAEGRMPACGRLVAGLCWLMAGHDGRCYATPADDLLPVSPAAPRVLLDAVRRWRDAYGVLLHDPEWESVADYQAFLAAERDLAAAVDAAGSPSTGDEGGTQPTIGGPDHDGLTGTPLWGRDRRVPPPAEVRCHCGQRIIHATADGYGEDGCDDPDPDGQITHLHADLADAERRADVAEDRAVTARAERYWATGDAPQQKGDGEMPDPIPRYAQLDVWMALGGDSLVFERWRDGRTFADAWAQLMAAVAGNVDTLRQDRNPPAGELLELLGRPAPPAQEPAGGWDRSNVERIIAMVAASPLGASGDGDQLRALLADRDRLAAAVEATRDQLHLAATNKWQADAIGELRGERDAARAELDQQARVAANLFSLAERRFVALERARAELAEHRGCMQRVERELAQVTAEQNRLFGLAERAMSERRDATAEVERLRTLFADSIDPATIPDQQAKSWTDWHPERYCHRCGRRNISWYADSAVWNEVHGGSGPIWCPTCFVLAHEEVTGRRTSWRLAPADRSDEVGALIQSEAAMRHEHNRVVAELAELQQLFELQWRRMAEATGLWRAEAPEERALIQPDLGALLKWLMDRADVARRDAAADALDWAREQLDPSQTGASRLPPAVLGRIAAEVRTGQRLVPGSPEPASGEEGS